MLHFPTVAVTADPQLELKKFLKNIYRLPVAALTVEPLAPVRHSVTYRQLSVFPFRIPVKKLPSIAGATTVALPQVTSLSISNLTRKIAQAAM
jgi:hypothetical protein